MDDIDYVAALHAFATAEGQDPADVSPPPPPISPPAGVVSDSELLNWFWKVYIPANEQHYRVYNAAIKEQKYRGPITTDCEISESYILEPKPEDANKSAFTDAELQILIDGSLRGDRFLSWKPLINDHHRLPNDVLVREFQLVNKLVPEMWLLSRAEVYPEIRDRTHDGEKKLNEVEWKELAIWVHQGYVGLNGRVFHYSRSAERLRQEVRVIEDLDNSTIGRLGEIFLKERAQAKPSALKRLVPVEYTPYKKGEKQTEEMREKQNNTKKRKREAEQGEAASASSKKDKKTKKGKKGDSKKGRDKDIACALEPLSASSPRRSYPSKASRDQQKNEMNPPFDTYASGMQDQRNHHSLVRLTPHTSGTPIAVPSGKDHGSTVVPARPLNSNAIIQSSPMSLRAFPARTYSNFPIARMPGPEQIKVLSIHPLR